MSKDWSDTASIKKSELINAPAEKVFAIAEDISNLPKYFAEFSSAARSGDSYQCAYDLRIVGIPLIELRATLSARDVKKPTALTYVIDGMAKGTVRWTLQEQGGGTLVSVDISYQMSTKVFQDTLGILGGTAASILGGAVNTVAAIIAKAVAANEANVGRALDNLKKLSEA